MKRLFADFHLDRKILAQFLLVFAAFLIMILIGSIFGSRIVNRNVTSYGEEVINSAIETVNAYLNESKLTLDDIAFSVERLKRDGADVDEMHAEVIAWTDWILGENLRFTELVGVYGFLDNEFLDGALWEPGDDYIPQSRVWYTGAFSQVGETYYADPYIDARTGETVLTASKVVFDKDGKPFGVVAIDMYMTSISEYINDLRLMDSGYGLMLDTNRAIVVHPDASVVGTPLENVNDGEGGYTDIASRLAIGREVEAYSFTTYAGVKSVAFFRQLDVGWYIGIIAPENVYYSDVYTMVLILSVAGLILMALLCAVLAILHIQKNRSDEANRVKSSFLANMSHEIRTPMNAIIGMTDLLLTESLNKRQQNYVTDISVSSHNLLAIINDILDLSKIEAGKLELTPVDYDFMVFVDNISSMFKYVAQKKELEFVFESEGEIPKCLYGDDIRLRQVLTNICGNAVKFTSTGHIRLKVTIESEVIIFEIEDTGMGIRKDELPKLFDAFAQADAQKNRSIVGTGLGLSISKNFVEMMGGTITVSSVYGQGTTFIVTIPKVVGDERAIRREDNSKKEKAFTAPSAKILVVDDNEVNLKVASGLLNLYKIHADTALSGKESIKKVQETDYDIVFMDHMMPEMDGIEATTEIRKLGGKYKHMIIVALTANAVHGAKELFMANGFDGFLSKPIDINELAETLKAWIPPDKIKEANNNGGHDTPPAGDLAADKGSGDEIEEEIDAEIDAEIDDDEDGVPDFMGSIEKIDGVNAEIGLSRVSGLEDMYRETVELFNKKLLPECEKMSGFLDGKDLKSFSISVHGMKSSLSTIGAMELSGTALELETASKGEELEYCEEHFPAFLDKLRSLHDALAVIIPNKDEAVEREEGNIEYLLENVQAAMDAAGEFDGDSALAAVGKLLEYDFGAETNELLENADSSMKDFNFDAAIDYLNKIQNTDSK